MNRRDFFRRAAPIAAVAAVSPVAVLAVRDGALTPVMPMPKPKGYLNVVVKGDGRYRMPYYGPDAPVESP